MTPEANAVRCVYSTTLANQKNRMPLAAYISEKAPYYYRKLPDLIKSIQDGLYVTFIKETLARLPTSDKFRESHFGEMLVSIFVEEIMNLRVIYSKLALLTAENANAFKMDLILYDPAANQLN
jgi:Cap4 SAVED domain